MSSFGGRERICWSNDVRTLQSWAGKEHYNCSLLFGMVSGFMVLSFQIFKCSTSIHINYSHLLFDFSQVEYKNMTPASALEYVRSRRPRVLLAPRQWKVMSNNQLMHIRISIRV